MEFLPTTSRDVDEDLPRMFPDGPPELPRNLRPVQVAQLSDMLAHIHDRMRSVIAAGKSSNKEDEPNGPTTLDWTAWQRLMRLEMELATYIRELTDPSVE